ncbi:MAG: helix-turn-helix domain-containing protein [Chloroflexi bacterium]|nr:helix-turn-helix domain-containing protein [Chloroflexota bacterium]
MALIGKSLREARVERGLTIEQVSQETRISARFLQALEAERFEELPAPVYVRGFLRSYANFLHLDPEPLVAELTGGGSPLAGPDAFVSGPGGSSRAPLSQRGRRNTRDPFQRQQPIVSNPPAMAVPFDEPRPRAASADEDSDSDRWAPEPPPRSLPAVGAPRADAWGAGIADDDASYEDDYVPPEQPFRSRRVSGVLMEHPPTDDGSGRSVRVIALVGLVAILGLAGLAGAALLNRGGDDSNAASGQETPGITPTAVVVVGTRTATPNAGATASATPPGGAAAAATPNGTATAATATPAASTPTVAAPTAPATATTAAEPTPTAEPPTVTPPSATATPVTPTSTPRPPTPVPTPTPLIPHPSAFTDCKSAGAQGSYDCGDTPFRVICPPDGDWFVDDPRNGPFPRPTGWPESTVGSLANPGSVCP